MDILRTPDECFTGVDPSWPEGRYATVTVPGAPPLRMHYVDRGEGLGGQTVVLLHGEPTWSYLYRDMVGPLVDAGYRCVVPDLVGFGRSDKPGALSDYTYPRQVGWLASLLFDHLDLHGVTMFAQDWGGLLGLRLLADLPDRFERVALANTFLPAGPEHITDAFLAWQQFAAAASDLDVGGLVDLATHHVLDVSTRAAYDAPFPTPAHKAGALAFPRLVPTAADDPEARANRQAWERLERFTRPVVCWFSDGDPITAGLEREVIARIPGARDQPHATITGAGHFLQEDRPRELADRLVAWTEGRALGAPLTWA